MSTLNEALTLKFKGDATHYNKTMKGLSSNAASTTKKISKSFMGIAKTLAKIGAAGAAAFTSFGIIAIKRAAAAETAYAKLTTLFREQKSELLAYKAAVDELTWSMGINAVKSAEAYYQAISSGFRSVADAKGVVEASAKAAIGGAVEIPVAVEAITRTLNAYSMSGKEAQHVSDLLFQTVNYGVTTFEQLAPEVGLVAGLAAKAKVPMEDLFAAIATISKQMPMAQTITGIAAMISGFIKPTEKAAEAAKKYGVELSATGLASKGLIGSLMQMASLSAEQQAELFPNIRALKGVMAATSNGAQDLVQNWSAMYEAAGAADNAFKKMQDTFGYWWDKLLATIGKTVDEIGHGFIPAMKILLEQFDTELGPKIKKWAGETSKGIADWMNQFLKDTEGMPIEKRLEVLFDRMAEWFTTKGMPMLSDVAGKVGVFIGKALAAGIYQGVISAIQRSGEKLAVRFNEFMGKDWTAAAASGDPWAMFKAFFEAWGGVWAGYGGNIPKNAFAGMIPNMAGGNIGEYVELMKAYQREKKMMPSGAHPVIANDSEWIIPSRSGGQVPNMAGGNGDLLGEAKLTNSLLMKSVSLLGDLMGMMDKTFNAVMEALKKLQEPLEVKPSSFTVFYGSGGFQNPGYASGGAVYGPPGTDAVNARLTAGEYVVNPDAASAFMPLLEAINASGGTYHDISENNFYFGDRFSDRLMADRVIPALQRAKRRGLYDQARRW